MEAAKQLRQQFVEQILVLLVDLRRSFSHVAIAVLLTFILVEAASALFSIILEPQASSSKKNPPGNPPGPPIHKHAELGRQPEQGPLPRRPLPGPVEVGLGASGLLCPVGGSVEDNMNAVVQAIDNLWGDMIGVGGSGAKIAGRWIQGL